MPVPANASALEEASSQGGEAQVAAVEAAAANTQQA